MLNSRPVDKIIFIDIESTTQYPTFKDMPENFQKLFKKQFKNKFKERNVEEIIADKYLYEREHEIIYSETAPLHAPWAKIVCISVGSFVEENITDDFKGDLTFSSKSFYGHDEKKLLNEFYEGLKHQNKKILDYPFNPTYHFSGHAIKLFDFPMIAKRFILNRMPLPALLDYGHKKPWELDFMADTLEVFKYGQFDGAVGLDMLAATFGVESSKNDMDGGMVKDVYWKEKDLDRIERYCREDVRVSAEVYLRLKNMSNKVNMKI